jgi:hypothetical protein
LVDLDEVAFFGLAAGAFFFSVLATGFLAIGFLAATGFLDFFTGAAL